jgi:hypothetical protein
MKTIILLIYNTLKNSLIKLVTLIVSVILLSAFAVEGQVSPSETGMKLFDDWRPDNTGTINVSDLLQAAVDWCIPNSKTLYISPGTYKVSKRILGKVTPGINN